MISKSTSTQARRVHPSIRNTSALFQKQTFRCLRGRTGMGSSLMSLTSCQRRVNEVIPDSIIVVAAEKLPASRLLNCQSTCNGQAISFLTAAPLYRHDEYRGVYSRSNSFHLATFLSLTNGERLVVQMSVADGTSLVHIRACATSACFHVASSASYTVLSLSIEVEGNQAGSCGRTVSNYSIRFRCFAVT